MWIPRRDRPPTTTMEKPGLLDHELVDRSPREIVRVREGVGAARGVAPSPSTGTQGLVVPPRRAGADARGGVGRPADPPFPTGVSAAGSIPAIMPLGRGLFAGRGNQEQAGRPLSGQPTGKTIPWPNRHACGARRVASSSPTLSDPVDAYDPVTPAISRAKTKRGRIRPVGEFGSPQRRARR